MNLPTMPLIQVVDDDAAVRVALGRLLRAAGYRVASAGSGPEFLAQAPQTGPSCVVLDLAMPGMGGLEVQRRMREAGDRRPILFLTGEGDVPSSVRAMKAGAVDFLTKPVDGDALLHAIAEALRRGEAEQSRARQRDDAAARAQALTEREAEVMRLVVAGLPNKRIAHELGIAEKTVKIHRGRVMAKMRADSLAELVRLAALLGTGSG